MLSSSTDQDVEMKDVYDDSDEEDEIVSALDPDEGVCAQRLLMNFPNEPRLLEPSDDEDEEEDELASEDEEDAPKPAKGEKNSQLHVGYKGDRSYVVRGDTVGVFDNKYKNDVKYMGTIKDLKTPKGVELRPDQVSLLSLLIL